MSLPDARYFCTVCTKDRRSGLTAFPAANGIVSTLWELNEAQDASLICATVMPDHFHWLFTLGGRLSVGQVLGKAKARMRPALANGGISLQKDFFEHRLRPGESTEAYARYVFLNPYVAELVLPEEPWPWWVKGADRRFEFEGLVNPHGGPPLEWLKEADALHLKLKTGE